MKSPLIALGQSFSVGVYGPNNKNQQKTKVTKLLSNKNIKSKVSESASGGTGVSGGLSSREAYGDHRLK